MKKVKEAFGNVYQEIKTDDNASLALKIQITLKDNEKKILQILNGKKTEHIIQIFAFEVHKDGIFTIMELGEKINFNIDSKKRKICLQGAKGVREFHQLGYFHRDIKPENFVISRIRKSNQQILEPQKRFRKRNILSQFKLKMKELIFKWHLKCLLQKIMTFGLWGWSFMKFLQMKHFLKLVTTNTQQILQITQTQIQKKLKEKEKKNKINKEQRELLEKMIISRLDENLQIIKSINRINLYDILISSKYIDLQTFGVVVEKSKKERSTDIFQFLQKHVQVTKKIKQNEFNRNNYSVYTYEQTRLELIKKIKKEKKIIEFLKFLVKLTAIDREFIQRTTLASCSQDKSIRLRVFSMLSIRLWDVKKEEQKLKLDGHNSTVLSVSFSPEGTLQASGSGDKSIRLLQQNWMVRQTLSFQYASLQMELCQLLVVKINLYDYGMLRLDNIYKILIKITKTFLLNTKHPQIKNLLMNGPKILILSLYPNRLQFKHKEHLFFKNNSRKIKEQIQVNYQNLKEVIFWKKNKQIKKPELKLLIPFQIFLITIIFSEFANNVERLEMHSQQSKRGIFIKEKRIPSKLILNLQQNYMSYVKNNLLTIIEYIEG
ncbi:unnamed protein product [Paramecium sonneborni]|uniref:Protein kinase domain-containing protein n=1 Tax=Paramecium sonneborni TaxID=65129 RepID=A0A8S1RM35_9CILI|nr:unnamed protein product [Paramecium sonneborni]